MADFMIRALLVTMAALTAAECQRPAPEETSAPASPSATASAPVGPAGPAPSVAASASSSDVVVAGRCVLATPVAPPAPAAPGPASGCPVDPEDGGAPLPVLPVAFPGTGASVEAELVRSEHDTMRGLMYRAGMASDRGMLFDLRSRDDHKFWMHNTCIPLDLMFIDEDGLIVGIVENAPTLDDTARGVGCPSRWVLEVNAGWSRQHGVKAGAVAKLPEQRTRLIVPQ
jgi:uncharacterized membrane protein (UPF0127 family)